MLLRICCSCVGVHVAASIICKLIMCVLVCWCVQLQYHPDKINTLREGGEAIEGTEEEVEQYLKDITQELARLMHSYGGE